MVFDIGGVLEHTPSTGWQRRWAAELGLAPGDLAGRLEPIWSAGSTGALSLTQVEAEVAEVLGLDQDRLTAFMRDAWTEYVGTLNHEMAAYFGRLRPRYRTGILSNSFVGAREREQAMYGFEDLCDVVVYSHEEGMIKPDARIYLIVCDRLGVRPAEAVLLDDTEACVTGARAVGMTAVRFVENEQALDELEALLRHGASA